MVLVHGNETLRDGNDTEILIFKFFPGLKKNRTQTENLKNRIFNYGNGKKVIDGRHFPFYGYYTKKFRALVIFHRLEA